MFGYLEPIPKNAKFTVTTGTWSDYNIIGVFQALREIDVNSINEQWRKEHLDENLYYSTSINKYLASLVRNGYIKPIYCFEWHIDGIGDMKIDKLET